MKIMGLLIVTAFSSFAIAQTAVKPKPVIRMTEPVEVKPAPIIRNGGTPSTVVAPSLEAFKNSTSKGALAAANDNVKGATCSLGQFAEGLSAGTRYSKEDAEQVVNQGILNKGDCGGPEGVVGYDVEARDNLISASLYVSDALKGVKVKALNPAQVAQLDTLWAKGLAQAKNRTAANDNQVTVASQIAVARQIKEACAIRN